MATLKVAQWVERRVAKLVDKKAVELAEKWVYPLVAT